MLPRERVMAVIRHETPDRVPVYGWVRENLNEEVAAAFGSVEAFEDHYEFDFAHLFGGPAYYPGGDIQAMQDTLGGTIDPPHALELALADPNRPEDYDSVVEQVRHHKELRGRFVYMQTPGFFEALNVVFGIENHLLYLLMYPEEIHELYRRQAEWNTAFAMNCLDLGVDMVHVSDDWGAQNSLMFSTDTWWSMLYPYHKRVVDAVKSRGAFVSLHSDGNISNVTEGIVKLGYDVVHPWQESAGMSLVDQKERHGGQFVLMGGLDIQTTLGFGDYPLLETSIERVLNLFRDGGLLFCTTHFVQEHCSMDELTFAYDTVYRKVRELAR